jgi:hypothetical protein
MASPDGQGLAQGRARPHARRLLDRHPAVLGRFALTATSTS